jgi:acetyl-CoA acetyltransferase
MRAELRLVNALHRLKDRIAIVGVGNTAYGNFPDIDDYGLGARAFRSAIEDCGLDKNKIDGLLTCRVPYYARMGEILGLNPRWTIQLPPHGRMSGMAIIEAAAALDAGLCDYAALIYANIGRSRRVNYGGDESPGVWDPWGFTSPGAAHALMFQRHRALYGTTTRQLAEVSVAFRHHACLNPSAVMKQPITIDDHEAARFITEPLRLLDYCLINDGAVCIIMTTKERARDLKKRPVMISGIGAREAYSTASISNFDLDFWYDEMRDVADQAYGICKQGEAGSFVEGGALKLGGRLPTNTDGGHLSNSYMQGWALNIEAVRQIRGECGARQVQDAQVVQYCGATPCSRSIIYTPG